MKTNLIFALMMTASMAMAQVMIPDGTKIRVRLEENLSSETAELGQTVDFAVTQEVRVGDSIVVANGARATGSIVKVEPRRHMGRAGEIDFTIERIQAVDGSWLNVRYTPQKNHGKGRGVTTGVVAAGIAVVFWPAAPLAVAIKGHEATVIKGRTYEVFCDDSTYIAGAIPATSALMARPLPDAQASLMRPMQVSNVALQTADTVQPAPVAATPAPAPSTANVAVTSNLAGADIEVDGAFVGSAPATLQLAAGMHHIAVKLGASSWERNLQVTSGDVNITATLSQTPTYRAAR